MDFDYDAAIRASLDEWEKEKLRRLKQQLLADVEARRQRFVESGKDESGGTVEGMYRMNKRLAEAALREDEFAKMIRGSGLNQRLKAQSGLTLATDCERSASDDLDDPTVYGDVFGDLQEAQIVAEEKVIVADMAEGVPVTPRQGWFSAVKDALIGGTRLDSSGRVRMEQRQGVGKKPRTLLVKPALRKHVCDTDGSRRTVASLKAQGVSEETLRRTGWLDELPTVANGGINKLGATKRSSDAALQHRLAEYSKLHERVGVIPSAEVGVPGLHGGKKRGRENISDGAIPTPQPAQKKRCGVDKKPLAQVLPSMGRRVRFADDA